jgi:hypothetical protein
MRNGSNSAAAAARSIASAAPGSEVVTNSAEERAPFGPRENMMSCVSPRTASAGTPAYGSTASKPAS